MSPDALADAGTIADVYPYHKPEWIAEYRSVTVSASVDGVQRVAMSADDIFSSEQKELMKSADVATPIRVIIKYIPQNNLKKNEVQTDDFVITIDPAMDASYPGGQAALTSYLESVIGEIGTDEYECYELSSIKFTIDEGGRVEGAHIFWPTDHESVDQRLLQSICNMPLWTPAQYADGTTVRQEYVLTAGNMKSCVVNMLNIKK